MRRGALHRVLRESPLELVPIGARAELGQHRHDTKANTDDERKLTRQMKLEELTLTFEHRTEWLGFAWLDGERFVAKHRPVERSNEFSSRFEIVGLTFPDESKIDQCPVQALTGVGVSGAGERRE